MLAVGGKLVVQWISTIYIMLENRCRGGGDGKVTHNNHCKIIILVFLLFLLSIVFGASVTSNRHLDDLSWPQALFNSFQIMTTMGYGSMMPYSIEQYRGWRCLVLFLYGGVTLIGLIMMAAFLNLSLRIIVKCDWSVLCCCCGGGGSGGAEKKYEDLDVSGSDYDDFDDYNEGESNKMELEHFLQKK